MGWLKSFIRTISPEAAEGELGEIHRAIGGVRGGIADIHQVQSLSPRALEAQLELYKAIVFQRSTLRAGAIGSLSLRLTATSEAPPALAAP